MAKKLDFDKEKNNRNDNSIEEIMQAIWCKDYRRNQQEVPERNQPEKQNRTRNLRQYTKQLWD